MVHASEAMPAELIRPSMTEYIKKKYPDWTGEGYICIKDLNRLRSDYIIEMMEVEQGELSDIEKEVVESLSEQELLSKNINEEYRENLSRGAKLADSLAAFGGSWTFIITFGLVLAVWICVNSLALFVRPFDPYPYILLILILSTPAALQAPVIMMSQNRQEAKDRMRSENDFKINLKAELEIRLISEKVDFLLTKQWQRMLEIQQIQIELMEELADLSSKPGKK